MATKNRVSSADREAAVRVVTGALRKADGETLRALLCAAVGHPPVVHSCFGQITCARCGDIVGDTLAGATSLEHTALVGHACPTCDTVIANLTDEQRLLTPLKET